MNFVYNFQTPDNNIKKNCQKRFNKGIGILIEITEIYIDIRKRSLE